MTTLTPEERRKFATYLREEAASCDGLAKQMETIKVADFVVRQKRNEAACLTLVAAYVESWEQDSI